MANLPNTSAELTAIAHEQLKAAAGSYVIARRLQVATLIAGLAAILVPRFAYFAAFSAFICQLASFYARNQGQQRQGVGDEIRRRALLLDALGPFDQAFDLAELLRKVRDGTRTRAVDGLMQDYFASSATGGLVRLRDHLRENAFWNRCLYHESAQRAMRFLAALSASAVLAYLLAVAIVPSSATVNLTRVFIALMAFLIGYALLVDVQSWKSAARTIESLDRRLDALKELPEGALKAKALGDLLAVFAEYTVATSKIAPIPEEVYKKHRDRLNDLWSERESGITTPLLRRSNANRTQSITKP